MLAHNKPQSSWGSGLLRQAMYLVAVFMVAGLQLWFSGVLILVKRTDALLGCNVAAGLIWLWYARWSYTRGNLVRMALSFFFLLGSAVLAVMGLSDVFF